MTATAGPFGLKPVGLKGGRMFNHAVDKFPIQSSYSTAIFNGDPVLFASGYITKAAYNFSAGGCVGVFLGCSYTDPTIHQPRWSNYYPASTAASDILAYVAWDPDLIFEAQLDGTTTSASLNRNTSFTNTLTGNTTNGYSTGALNASAIATTNTLQWRIIGIKQSPDNDWTSAFPIVRVMFNYGFHQLATATGA